MESKIAAGNNINTLEWESVSEINFTAGKPNVGLT
jgi:hypothetical protein